MNLLIKLIHLISFTNMNLKLLFSFTYIFILINTGISQNGINQEVKFPASTVNKLESVIAKIRAEQNLPGLVVGIWIPGEGEYTIALGSADLKTKLHRDINSQFRIASITKTFIATAILKLVSEGRMSKVDKLSKWFPDFPDADAVTIEYLLQMRSGIYDSADEELMKLYYNNPLIKINADSMISRSAKKERLFTVPDVNTQYCNVNYIFLEQILQKVTGKNTNDYLSELIFKPLGMSNTFYPYDSNLPGNLHGYGWNHVSKEFEDKTDLNPELPGGAGAIISNMADLKTYAKALYTGELLTPVIQKERLYTNRLKGLPDFVGYGEGIVRMGKFWGHTGTIMGFSSEMFYLPEKDAVIIINVNRLDENDKSCSSELFEAITRIMFPDHVDW